MAHLQPRVAVEIACARDTSLRINFADVVTAFASMPPRTAIDCVESNEHLAARIAALGFSHADVDAIMGGHKQHAVWNSANSNQHFMAQLSDMHRSTWALLDGVHNVLRATTGVLAGSPLGDLVFNMCMTCVLSHVRAELLF